MLRTFKNFAHLLNAVLANVYFGFPGRKITVIGVTGTDGKTTTVHLIYHLLKQADKKVSMISTVQIRVGNTQHARGLHATTPSPWILQKMLRQSVNQGDEYFVLEVTSHGLDQHRVWGIPFTVGVLTNVTHEHLDYHQTMEQYVRSKLKLLQQSRIAIFPHQFQISHFKFLNKLSITNNQLRKQITFGLKKGNVTLQNFPFSTSLAGDYNKLNCLAAISVAQALKISNVTIRSALPSFTGVRGRMEEVNTGKGFRVIIDYAHTPYAFENVLKTLKPTVKGRLIHVFGACGGRDRSKRPLMGEIAARYDDVIILTEEDYGTENVTDIIRQLEDGINHQSSTINHQLLLIIPDRSEAIGKAVTLAKNGDLILLTGIGHQRFMTRGREEVPWDEKKEVERSIKQMNEQ